MTGTGPLKTCPMCGEEFGPRPRESRGQFADRVCCSKPCAFAARRAASAARRGTKTCLQCGVEYGPTEHQRRHPKLWAQRKFCTRECAVAHRKANPVHGPPAPRKPDLRRGRNRKPRPELSVFGDRKPTQTWRPAGFSATPRRVS